MLGETPVVVLVVPMEVVSRVTQVGFWGMLVDWGGPGDSPAFGLDMHRVSRAAVTAAPTPPDG